jgi:hypothetical protein
MSLSFGTIAFQYPSEPHVRRHGPYGYHDYKSYKPWLRDEFVFRCVYCLVRERWCHDGANGFGVDHLMPKSFRPDLECEYTNLLYLCNRCNSAKRLSTAIDPCSCALSEHLKMNENGAIEANTKEGQYIIDAFNLNYSMAKGFRKRKIDLLTRCRQAGDNWIIEQELGFPDDLPQLTDRNCSNRVPQGVADSYHEQNHRGELPTMY